MTDNDFVSSIHELDIPFHEYRDSVFFDGGKLFHVEVDKKDNFELSVYHTDPFSIISTANDKNRTEHEHLAISVIKDIVDSRITHELEYYKRKYS